MSPRRVLIVENTIRGLGGSYESLYLTARSLHRDRFEPVALFFQPNRFAERLETEGIRVVVEGSRQFWEREGYIQKTGKVRSSLPRRGLLGEVRRRTVALLRLLVGGLPMARTVRRVIRREGIDLLHTNNNLQRDAMAILGGAWARVPIVAHERQLARCSALTGSLSTRVHTLICISDAVLEFTRTSGARPQRRRRIHNAIDLTEVRGVRPALEAGPRRLGIVGRILPKKGQRHFVEAAAQVRARFPGAEFYVVGEATGEGRAYEAEVRSLAASLGIADAIRWTGYLSEPLALVASLDVLVHAAVEPEPFGRVVIEGLALGIPVVATAVGGPVEIIEDGISGFLVPPADPGAIAARAMALLEDADLRGRIREGALRRVEEGFAIEPYIRAVEDVYEEALASVGPGARGRGGRGPGERGSAGRAPDGGSSAARPEEEARR